MLGIAKDLDLRLTLRLISYSSSAAKPLLPLLHFATKLLAWGEKLSNAIMIVGIFRLERHNKHISCAMDTSHTMIFVTRIPRVRLMDRIRASLLQPGCRQHLLETINTQWPSGEYVKEQGCFLFLF